MIDWSSKTSNFLWGLDSGHGKLKALESTQTPEHEIVKEYCYDTKPNLEDMYLQIIMY